MGFLKLLERTSTRLHYVRRPSYRSRTMASNLKQAIKAVNVEIDKAFAKPDIDTVASLYTEDASMIQPGGVTIRGRKDIHSFYVHLRQNKKAMELITDEVGMIHTDAVAYERGHWTSTSCHGKIVKGGYLTIRKFCDGKWKLYIDCIN
eukprot:m.108920 g.108920  ORF g.108920 m.108920 type:complete len:148 (+) comp37329_c0_seq13:16-459(+)